LIEIVFFLWHNQKKGEHIVIEAKMMKATVRYYQAKRGDTDEMDTLNRLCMPENYEKEVWHAVLAQHLSWVAKHNRKVVGYILVRHTGIHARVTSLAVHPDFRCQGIATKLLTKVIKRLQIKEERYLNLHAREHGDAAHLYRKLGFQVHKKIKNYYSNPPDNALDMSLLVTSANLVPLQKSNLSDSRQN
jgi:ribosomal-protein-alanine N-acetyltransferase